MHHLELLSWRQITALDAPWAYFVACTERDMDNQVLGEFESVEGCVSRIVRGRRSNTRDELFQEWAAALQFSYYFGHNWDAFDDCITDLRWLPASSYVVVATHIEDVLRDFPEDFQILIDLLRDAVDYWASRSEPKPFRVIFHCREANEDRAWLRLEQAGVAVERRRVRNFARSDEPET